MHRNGDAHGASAPHMHFYNSNSNNNNDDDDDATQMLMPPSRSAASSPDRWAYYSRLGLTPRASTHDVRRAFLELSQRYHTDKHAQASAATQAAMGARFRELQEAYAVLMDARQRAAYDAVGVSGVKALALVPATALPTRERIVQYVLFLDKAQRLRELATATSTTSEVVVTYNTTVPAALLWRAVTHLATAPHTAAAATTKTTTHSDDDDSDSQQNNNDNDAAAAAAHDEGDDDAAATATTREHGDGAVRLDGVPMRVAELDVNGARQLVVLLPAEAQAQLRRMIQAQQQQQQQQLRDSAGDAATSVVAVSPPSGAAAAQRQQLWLLLRRALDATLLPQRVRASYSFRHVLSPQTELQLRTWAHSATARSGGGGNSSGDASVGVKARVQHRGQVTNTALQWSTAPQHMKVTLERERVLSPLSRLQTRLVLFKDWLPLTKLYLTLQTTLSRHSALHNTLCLSWLTSGYWQATVLRAALSSTQQCMLRIGADVLSVVVRVERAGVLGARRVRNGSDTSRGATRDDSNNNNDNNGKDDDENNDHDDNDDDDDVVCAGDEDDATASGATTDASSSSSPMLRPRRVHVTEAVQLSHAPFTAMTTLRYELWCRRTPLQRYGVAWQSTLVCPSLAWARHDGTRVRTATLHSSSEGGSGVMLHEVWLLYQRGRNRVAVPVTLFVTTRWSTAVAWVALPIVGFRVAEALYRVRARRAARRYYIARRRAHVAAVDVARAAALQEQAALEAAVLRARAAEERCGGLVIVNARYGVLSPRYVDAAPPPPAAAAACAHGHVRSLPRLLLRLRPPLSSWWRRSPLGGAWRACWRRVAHASRVDTRNGHTAQAVARADDAIADADIDLTLDVTLALQNLVHDSALTLPRGSKRALVGFCDPDPYTPERKQLKIAYRFQHALHVVVVDDGDEVQLPQREHRV